MRKGKGMKISVTTQNIIDVFGDCEKHVYVNPADRSQYAIEITSGNLNLKFVLNAEELDSLNKNDFCMDEYESVGFSNWNDITGNDGVFCDVHACDILDAFAKMIKKGCVFNLVK